jgi:hypothetical protein
MIELILAVSLAVVAPPHIDTGSCVVWSESTVIDSNGDEWNECEVEVTI